MSLSRILVVDDEPQIQRFLKPALAAAEFEVLSAGTAAEARKLIATAAPDLVILDLGLPDADGKTVIAAVRPFSDVPIIVLSARDREADKIDALDLGADDYVEKPFGIGELLARIRTALRHRRKGSAEMVERFESGGLVFDVVRRQVSVDGVPVHLTPKEHDLLLLLLEHAGRVLTHKHLLERIWGPAHGQDVQYLRVMVGQLRAKIERDPARPRLILNEPGVGYRFAEDPG
jgi:two-component system, OmpR family, KDP operon response regulator KdpE